MELFKTPHPIMNGHKMQTTYFLVVFAIVARQTFAKTFPEYIQKCKVSDPKFDECTLNSANNAVSIIFRGDSKYDKPPVPQSNKTKLYNVTENFHFKLTNLSSNFHENIVITHLHFDLEKKVLDFVANAAEVYRTANYEATGEILGKPVHENGKVNMTFDPVEASAVVKLDFKMKNDKKYIEAVSCALVFNVKNFHFKPSDQVTVGEPMTAEQKEVYQKYIEKIPEEMKKENEANGGDEVVGMLNAVFETLPFEDIFIP